MREEEEEVVEEEVEEDVVVEVEMEVSQNFTLRDDAGLVVDPG